MKFRMKVIRNITSRNVCETERSPPAVWKPYRRGITLLHSRTRPGEVGFSPHSWFPVNDNFLQGFLLGAETLELACWDVNFYDMKKNENTDCEKTQSAVDV